MHIHTHTHTDIDGALSLTHAHTNIQKHLHRYWQDTRALPTSLLVSIGLCLRLCLCFGLRPRLCLRLRLMSVSASTCLLNVSASTCSSASYVCVCVHMFVCRIGEYKHTRLPSTVISTGIPSHTHCVYPHASSYTCACNRNKGTDVGRTVNGPNTRAIPDA